MINIFIVSPSDVSLERNIAKDVCKQLDNIVGKDIEINSVMWEYYPMSYHKDPQANIDKILESSDIFVIILWNRLGSIIEGYQGVITQSTSVTGTQYEIEKILATKKESVFFYFKIKQKNFASEELEEAWKQRQMLDTFLKDINLTKGSTQHGYQEFLNENDFRERLTKHLKLEIERITGRKLSLEADFSEPKGVLCILYGGIAALALLLLHHLLRYIKNKG